MKRLLFVALGLCLALSAKSEGVRIIYNDAPALGRTPFYVNDHSRRLNTAECQDADDWYLDGYRVAKTHGAYGQNLLNQRLHYCQSQGFATASLKNQWLQGFRKAGGKFQKALVKKGKKKGKRRNA